MLFLDTASHFVDAVFETTGHDANAYDQGQPNIPAKSVEIFPKMADICFSSKK